MAEEGGKMAAIPDNDEFMDIFLTEDKAIRAGFDEGEKAGRERGEAEGCTAGLEKGKEIGEEIGMYFGYCETYHLKLSSEETSSTNDKKIKKLSGYIETLKDFKITNIDSDGYTDDLQVLRGKFHQMKSLCDNSTVQTQLTNTQ